jgi:Protein of unknown function (DUF3159)
MVHEAGTPAAPGGLDDLPEPTWRLLLGRGLPVSLTEGVLPLAVFYILWRTAGLGAAIVVATLLSLAISAWAVRRGEGAALALVTGAFIVVQAVVSLATHDGTIYLARPIFISAAWGIGYLVSVWIGRPLIGVLAAVWYPFPGWFQASVPFRREFGLQSIVWGIVCLTRAAGGAAVILALGNGTFLAYATVTGFPLVAVLIAWGLRHARRSFGALDAVPV